ncbi:metalloregulator ArsR/SmtB family transcription factor [Marinibaculum pumilum]|uniref:Metalloregulator ArsR/SmtB family transcription factor n=1 Tax=Marinibaculum pumilum TaxID=1766165 RepID=A0ABV7L8S7_9PROT
MELKEVTALAALAHPTRLAIFRLLVRRAPGDVPAGEIAAALGVRANTLSQQLAQLSHAGLIAAERQGRSIRYRVVAEEARHLVRFLVADCCKGRPDLCDPLEVRALRRQPWPAPEEEREMSTDNKGEDWILNVLFLCTGNSARSLMAEAILNRVGQGRFQGFSAGSMPRGEPHAFAMDLLRRLNYPTGGLRTKSWDEFAAADAPRLDFVFTVCDQAANEACPVWPGQPMTAHWGLPDPVQVAGSETERRLAFAEAYRGLFNRISIFTSLPLASLDRLSLQRRLDEIGTAQAPAGDRLPA